MMSFRVASVALCDIPRVSEGICVSGPRDGIVAVSVGEAARTCLSKQSQEFVMSFRGSHGTS